MNEYTKYLQVLCNQLGVKDKYGRVLQEDGILGELTREAIKRLPSLQINTTGHKEKIAITHIQNVLKITADGIFGTATYTAVVSFQRRKGLSADGIVGPNTWVAFSDPYGSNTTNPPSTGKLPTGWVMPIAHGTEAGYSGDTGLDIAAPVGTACYAVAGGTIIYSEYGHTPWRPENGYPNDTPNSVLIKLDTPVTYQGRTFYYIWYTHLSSIKYNVADNSSSYKPHISSGTLIGYSGKGNNNAHLHFGAIIDRAQNNSSHYLSMEQVRGLLNLQPHQQI